MMRHTIFQLLILCGYVFVINQSRSVSDNTDSNGDQTKKPFTLYETFTYAFYTSEFMDGTWISDNEIRIVHRMSGNIIVYNVATEKNKTTFNGSNLPMQYVLSVPIISPDEQHILFGYNSKSVFRHSTVKSYVIYDVQNRKFEKIANGASLSLVLWSPVGGELVYVRDNDIYHMNLTDGKNVTRRLTKTGKAGIVYNGIPDWVYEEEVFASAIATWYSPDGRHLAFATFNDTEVKDIAFSHYGSPGSLEDQYPKEVKIKYPKVGTSNPVVSLSVIDLTDASSKAVTLEAPVDVVGSDNILFTVNWWDKKHVMATWTNRVQNKSQLVMYDTQGGSKQILYDEETEGWLEPNRPVKAAIKYALLLRRVDSGTDAGRFRHINRYEYDGSRFVSPVDLTPGPSEVRSVLAVDGSRGKVYYLATAPGEPTRRNLYSVPLDGSQKPTCISCELLTPEGNKCTYANAFFSTRRTHYALACSGPDPVTIIIYDENHRPILTWQTNSEIRRALSKRLMPQQRDFNITVNGYDSRVRLLLPPNFDENEKYPMLVHVYAGPNSARILDISRYGYEYYMSTNKRVIYALIDARGSAYKGSKMLFEIYRNVGTVEVEDTIAVTAALQRRYKWIDTNKTGIWGWSYGGFTTGMALATDADFVFKCGISVAPVSSWIYYDSIMTERVMGLPTFDDNLAGYDRTDITQRVQGIRGKKYMLIHGTGDDNVHFQQAMVLAKSLEYNDILFEQITYTDEAHGLVHVMPHLYHTMDKFWDECFDLDRTD